MNDLSVQTALAPLPSRFQSHHQDTPTLEDSSPATAINALRTLPAGEDFADRLKDAVRSVNQEQQQASTLQTRFELGDDTVSLPQIMLAMNRASISFDAINQVRNRLLSAYQEVMGMQV